MSSFEFLYDVNEATNIRYVSFFTDHSRFDLAIIRSERFFGKSLVLDIQNGRLAIVGKDDLDEPGYLEYAFGISEDAAEELKDFLTQISV